MIVIRWRPFFPRFVPFVAIHIYLNEHEEWKCIPKTEKKTRNRDVECDIHYASTIFSDWLSMDGHVGFWYCKQVIPHIIELRKKKFRTRPFLYCTYSIKKKYSGHRHLIHHRICDTETDNKMKYGEKVMFKR